MPDDWEDAFGDLQPRGDGDEDGIPNLVEYLEGLDPTVDEGLEYLILEPGWNLAAVSPGESRQTLGGFFAGKIIGCVWLWDPAGGAYRGADNRPLDSRYGVWVYAPGLSGIRLSVPAPP
jgi:hypothetical protein